MALTRHGPQVCRHRLAILNNGQRVKRKGELEVQGCSLLNKFKAIWGVQETVSKRKKEKEGRKGGGEGGREENFQQSLV